MDEIKFVFVPSIVDIDGIIEGLGIYSEESLALEKLKKKLTDNWSSGYKEAQLVMWTLNSDEKEAVPLKHMYAKVCPICDERAFWTDVVEMNALCYLPACQAWIEHSDIEEDKVDCGWPPIGFTAQLDSLEEALSSLRNYGAKKNDWLVESPDLDESTQKLLEATKLLSDKNFILIGI